MNLLRHERNSSVQGNEGHIKATLDSKSQKFPMTLWIEMIVGLLSLSFLSLVLVLPDWIELLFRSAPDAGDGSLERSFALLLGGLSILMFGLAGRTLKRHVRLRQSA
jgi:hypothetical protein